MQYCAHLFIGKEFEILIENSFQIYCKYNAKELGYNRIYNVTSDNDTIEIKEYKATLDPNTESIIYSWESLEPTKVSELSTLWEEQIFDKILILTTANGQTSLPVFIHTPLAKSESFKLVSQICGAINKTQRDSNVNFIGYAQDMWRFIDTNQKSAKDNKCNTVSEIKAIYDKYNFNTEYNHFIVIQNRTERGIAIFNDDNGTLALYNMVAHIYMLLSYPLESIFPQTYTYRDVIGIGFSSLYFDEYMFVDYMLRKVMTQAIDNQSVNNNDVDINVAGNLADSILKDKKTLFSDFLEKYPDGDKNAPDYNEIKSSIEEIHCRVLTYFNNSLNRDMTAKAALLAAMLSKTECELFASSVYRPELTCIDDLYSQAIDHYIAEDDVVHYKIDDEKPQNYIKEIKDINIKLIQSEVSIRTLEEQLSILGEQIDKNDDVKKCVIDDDGFFTYKNRRYKLLPHEIEEPLQETYQEHEVKVKSVDLRSKFSAVKSQGQQGSCLSFTLTSIFEYMMRINAQEDCDLSEAFLYYNARNMDTSGDVNVNVDKGSRFKPSMESLAKYGIALEKYWPYNEGVYAKKPSDEAYADAEKRKLIKALNVNKNSAAIKSALSDGYPVAGSFVLLPSFGGSNGYVSMPTEEEMASIKSGENAENKHSTHAMTIVGFSDDINMFLVRNSWGTDWGDKGYCYIPYAYVDNPDLFNYACIIAEVASLEVKTQEIKDLPALKINNDDLYVRYLITKTEHEYQIKLAEELKKERIRLIGYFELQKRKYSDPNDRNSFIEENVAKIEEDITTSKQEVNRLNDEIELKTKALDKFRNGLLINGAIVITLIFLFAYLFNKLFSYISLDLNVWQYAIIASVIYGVILCIRYRRKFIQWRNEKRDLELTIENLESHIRKEYKRKLLFRHKTFAAWMLITTLDSVQLKLQNTYTNIVSLINNLRIWYNEIKSSSDNISFELPLPYISVLDSDKLDSYFDSRLKVSSVCDIDLCKDIENHVIDLDYLSEYKKGIRKVLKKQLVEALNDMGFNLSSHITENKFNEVAVEINPNIIKGWVEQSRLFVHIRTNNRTLVDYLTLVFANDANNNEQAIKDMVNDAYVVASDDRYRITMMRFASLSFDECVMFQ